MFKIITKFLVISVGCSVLLHLFLSYFHLYQISFIVFNPRYLLFSLTFGIAMVSSLPELSKKKIGDTLKNMFAISIGMYVSFLLIDYVLKLLF